MDWEPNKTDGEPDPLDRLLADARWPEPAPEAIVRLRGQWRSLLVRRSRRRRRLFALATAGTLLAVVATFWQCVWRTVRPNRENNVAATSASPAVQPTVPKTEAAPALKRPKAASSVAKHRPNTANPYELMMIAAHRRSVRERRRQLAAAETLDAVAEVEEPADRAAEPPIRALAEASDSPTLGRLAIEEQDPVARKELLSALLMRDDPPSVKVFLELVENPRTSADALDCVSVASNPPVKMLFQCLRSSSASRRMAAARVLGRLDQPEVSRELIAMVCRGVYRQEAMVALMSSSEETAKQFLANAERDPMLSATLWNAKRLFQTSSLWRS